MVQQMQALMQQQLAPDAWQWLQEKAAQLNTQGSNALAVAFAAMPRKAGKAIVDISAENAAAFAAIRPHFTVNQWSIDRLCRVWLLLQLNTDDEAVYVRRIETLFPAAEMNELVALYSALPLLAYPEAWRGRCAEGIRSNIGPVLEAIICNNPYPSEQLPDGAWNQLVLKAFFTEKRIDQIIGLDGRANVALADTLIDFARERRAAGREVPPMLWRCVAPFISAENIRDVEGALYSTETNERAAAALALSQSSLPEAKALLQKNNELTAEVHSGALSWKSLAARMAGE